MKNLGMNKAFGISLLFHLVILLCAALIPGVSLGAQPDNIVEIDLADNGGGGGGGGGGIGDGIGGGGGGDSEGVAEIFAGKSGMPAVNVASSAGASSSAGPAASTAEPAVEFGSAGVTPAAAVSLPAKTRTNAAVAEVDNVKDLVPDLGLEQGTGIGKGTGGGVGSGQSSGIGEGEGSGVGEGSGIGIGSGSGSGIGSSVGSGSDSGSGTGIGSGSGSGAGSGSGSGIGSGSGSGVGSGSGSGIGSGSGSGVGSGSGSGIGSGSGNMQAPSVLYKVAPEYPEDLRQSGVEGTVTVKFLVLSDGSVGDCWVISSSGYQAMDNAALKAAGLWQFVPAKQRSTGIALECYTRVDIIFRLR